MSAENEAVARRFFDEMCNGRRYDVADEILAADHRYHDPQSPPSDPGPEGMKRTVAIYADGLEGRWEVHDVFSAGDQVAARWTGHGVHSSEIMGLSPTGKEIHVEAITILRMAGGKIAENWTAWDTLGMLQQIGAVPAPTAA
jgi:ketosteroid isomerase-like protein